MRIIIFGFKGQLGHELMRQGRALNLDIQGIDLPQTDITDLDQVIDAFAAHRPSQVVNAAAYTNVDGTESEIELAMSVNRDGSANIARLCADNKIPLIHISTDYVFDGEKGRPYQETDPVSPIGVYGRSKAAGESAVRSALTQHIILRTAWLYGSHGHNFVKTMIRLAREKKEIQVVSDQYGTPTAAADLAESILRISDIIQKRTAVEWGTYHYCGHGILSWHEFAEAIVDICRQNGRVRVERVRAIKTADYPTKVRRPRYSALDCSLIKEHFGIDPKPWRSSLAITVHDLLSSAADLPQDLT